MNFSTTDRFVSLKATADKFDEFRRNDKFCDVVLVSGDTAVKAHRAMLAATSPYFETMLSGDYKEKRQESIDLSLTVHPDVLRSLVDFLYTGRTTISESTVHHLMAAAHMLQIEELVSGCAQYMKAQLNPINVLTAFRCGETFSCTALSEHALVYAGRHWSIVAQGQEFLELSLSHFIQILSSDNFGVDNELDVLVSVVRWLEHEPATRAPHWLELVPLLRLGRVSTHDLDVVCKNVKDTHLAKFLSIFDIPKRALEDARPRTNTATSFYIVGGCQKSSQSPLATVFKYDVRKKVWDVMAPMSTPRYTPGVAALEGRLYAVGGSDDRNILSSGEVYEPANNKWSPIAAMNIERMNFGLAALDGKLYAFGGYSDGGRLSSVEVYEPVSDTWTLVGDIPHVLIQMSVVTYEGAVYLAGGTSSSGTSRSLLRYSPGASGGQWHSCADMSSKRYAHAAAVLDHRLYVVGGYDENNRYPDTVDRYDFAKDRWETVSHLQEGRIECAAVAAGGELLVAGGLNKSTKDSLDIYTVDNKWSTGPSMPQPRWGMGYALL